MTGNITAGGLAAIVIAIKIAAAAHNKPRAVIGAMGAVACGGAAG